MSSEENIHPLLDTRTVIQQVKDIQKRHPSLIPNEDDIHTVFDNRNYIVAKALYNNMDGYIEKAGVTAETTIPGTGKNLMGTMNACDYSKPSPSYSCRQALAYYTALQGGGAERPMVRSVMGVVDRLRGGEGSSPLEAIALDAANERTSSITRHKGTDAYKIGDRTINMMQSQLMAEENNMKALAQSFGRGLFASAKNKAYITKNNAYGAAVHDMRMVASKSTSSEELFAGLNNILDGYDENKTLSEETKEKLAGFMKGASDHVPGYEAKIDKVLNKEGFAEAYINKVREMRDQYAYDMFSLSMRDGSAQAEQGIQMALKGIPSGNKDAAKKAIHDLGKKIHGEKNYNANIKSAVDAYINNDLEQIIEKYGNKLTPEEMQMVKRDIYNEVPDLENYEEEVTRMNQKISLHGSSAQYSLDDPKNLPKRFLEYYAKHVTKNMLHAEGEAGLVKASQYFQGALSEDMIKDARNEYEKEVTNKAMYTMGMGFDIGELAPRWKKFNDNEGLFDSLSFPAQTKVLGELHEELKNAADKIMDGQPDIAKKNVIDNMLDKFYPVPEAQRQKREAYLHHLADPHKVGNTTITTKSLLEKPLSFAKNNPKKTKELMYTDGYINKFGQFITEAKHMSSRAFTHPILSHSRSDGTRKDDGERYNEIKDMVDSVPPEYHRDIFSPDILSIANGSYTPSSDEWSEQKLVGDKYAISKGFDTSNKSGVENIKRVRHLQMGLANDGIIDIPQNYREVIDNMDILKDKMINDIGLSPEHIDKIYEAFTDTHGADTSNKMMQEREFVNRTPGTSRLTDAGVYNANETDESLIRNNALKWMSTRKDLAKMRSPPKGSSWAEWATVKGAQGIDKAYKEVETNRIGSKSTTDPVGYVFQSSEDTVVGAMTDLAKKLGREVTYDDLDQYGDPEANEYVQAHMRELKRIAMRSGIIGGRYEALTNAKFNDQPAATQNAQIAPQVNQMGAQAPQMQAPNTPQIRTIEEQMNDLALLSAAPDKLLYDSKRREYKKRTDAQLANAKNTYDKRLTNDNLDDINRKDSLIKLKAVLEEIKDRKNAPATQQAASQNTTTQAPPTQNPPVQNLTTPIVAQPQGVVAQTAQAPGTPQVADANQVADPVNLEEDNKKYTQLARELVMGEDYDAFDYKDDISVLLEDLSEEYDTDFETPSPERDAILNKERNNVLEAIRATVAKGQQPLFSQLESLSFIDDILSGEADKHIEEGYKAYAKHYIDEANVLFSKNGAFDTQEFLDHSSILMDALKEEHPEIAWDKPSEERDAVLRNAKHEYIDDLEDDPDNKDYIKTVAVLDDLLTERPEERYRGNIPANGGQIPIKDSDTKLLDQNAVNSAAEDRRKEFEDKPIDVTNTSESATIPQQTAVIQDMGSLTEAPQPQAPIENKPDSFSKNKEETWDNVLTHEGVRNDQYVRVGVGEAKGPKFKNEKQFTDEITRVNNALDSLDGTENINKKKKLLGNLLGTQTLYDQWKKQQEKKTGKTGKDKVIPEKGSGASKAAGVNGTEAVGDEERGDDRSAEAKKLDEVKTKTIEESKDGTGIYGPADTDVDIETDEQRAAREKQEADDKESKRLFDEAAINANIARQAEATKINNAPAQAAKIFKETARGDHIGIYKQAKNALNNPELGQAERIQAENIVRLYDETYKDESPEARRARFKRHTDAFKDGVELRSKDAGFNEKMDTYRNLLDEQTKQLLNSAPQTLDEALLKNNQVARLRESVIEEAIGRSITTDDYAKFAVINSAMEQGVWNNTWKPKQVQNKPQATSQSSGAQATVPGRVSLVDETGGLTKITSPEMARDIENRINIINAFSQKTGLGSRTKYTTEMNRKDGVIDDNLRAEMKDRGITSKDDIYRMDKESKVLSQAKNALINYNREQNKAWANTLPIAKEGQLDALKLYDVEDKDIPKEAKGKINAFVDQYYTKEAMDKIISEYSSKYEAGKKEISSGNKAVSVANYNNAMQKAAKYFGHLYNQDINQDAYRGVVAENLGLAHAIYEKLPKRAKEDVDSREGREAGSVDTNGKPRQQTSTQTTPRTPKEKKEKAVAIAPPNYKELNEEQKNNVAQTEATAKKHYDWYTQRNDIAGFKVAMESERAGLFKYIDPMREGRELAPEVQAQLAYSVQYLDSILKELEETKKIPNIPSISGARSNDEDGETSQVEEKIDSEPIKVVSDNADDIFDEEARSWVRPLGKEMKALKDQENEVYLNGLKEYRARFSEATDVKVLKNTLESSLKTLSEVKDDDRIKTLAKIRRIEARIQEIGKEERKKFRGAD